MTEISYIYYIVAFGIVFIWTLFSPWKRGAIHLSIYTLALFASAVFMVLTADSAYQNGEKIIDIIIIGLLFIYLALNLKSGAWKTFSPLKDIGVNENTVDKDSQSYKAANYVFIAFIIACIAKAVLYGL